MAQSNASNVTPIHGGGILAAGTVAPNFTLHVTPDLLVDFEPKGAVAENMAPTALQTASANALSSSSIRTESSPGAIARRLR